MRHRHLSRTGAIHVLAQVVVLAALYAVGHDRTLGVEGVWRDAALVALVFAQSAIWVAFFYLQDRAAPEPTGYVLVAFVAGMAAASLVALPAESTLFHLASWMYRSNTNLMLGATCVRGTIASVLVYAIIRYGFAPTREFDEPADGMAYGAFIGSGFAAVLSLSSLAAHTDFTLFAVAQSAATNVLVYASVGALVGYLVGRTKFQTKPGGAAHALAILAGAILIGLYQVLVESALTAGSSQPLLAGAGTAVVFAVVVLGAATALMYRVTAHAPPVQSALRSSDALATGAATVLLAVGAFATYAGTRSVVFLDAHQGISFTYDPIRAIAGGSSGSGAITQAAFTKRGSIGLPLVFTARTPAGATIVVQRSPGSAPIDKVDPRRFLSTSDPLGLTMSDVSIGGRHGLRMRYAYLLKPGESSRELPRLQWAYTDVVPGATGTYALTFDAAPEAFGRDEPVYSAVLATVSWSEK